MKMSQPAMNRWYRKLQCRETLLVAWAIPFLIWCVLLLRLPTKAKEDVTSAEVHGLMLSLFALFIPTALEMLAWWFRKQHSNVVALTARRFWIAFISLCAWGIFLTWFFVEHVYCADYSKPEAWDEFVEGRMHAFVRLALVAYVVPKFIIEALFSGQNRSDRPINHS
jgi:hypothetical protein